MPILDGTLHIAKVQVIQLISKELEPPLSPQPVAHSEASGVK
jgi:hypothetical protein